MAKPAPRKNLGSLEGAVLITIRALDFAGIVCSVPEIYLRLTEVGQRKLALGNLYSLLENLERKKLIEHETKFMRDSREAERNINIYSLTIDGIAAASREFKAESAMIEWARSAFAQVKRVFA